MADFMQRQPVDRQIRSNRAAVGGRVVDRPVGSTDSILIGKGKIASLDRLITNGIGWDAGQFIIKLEDLVVVLINQTVHIGIFNRFDILIRNQNLNVVGIHQGKSGFALVPLL